MTTLVKITEDGRKLEVKGFALYLDGALEAVDLTEVKMHPAKRKIWSIMPDATHVAGRVALNAEETAIVKKALSRRSGDDAGRSDCNRRTVPHRRHVESAGAGNRVTH